MKKLLTEGDLQQQNRSKKENKNFAKSNHTSYNLWSTILETDRNQEEKLGAVQRNTERKIVGIRWEPKISNEKLKKITEGRYIGYIQKKLKLS